MKTTVRATLRLLLACGLLAACGTSKADDGAACEAGATRECVGPGACKGGQQCLEDGSAWGACSCGDPPGSAGSNGMGASSGADGGGSTSAGSSSGGSNTGGSTGGCQVNPPVFVLTASSDFAGKGLQIVSTGKKDGGELPGKFMVDSDGTGTTSMMVEAPPGEPAKRELHFTGSAHTGWGADVAVTFVDANTPIDVGFESAAVLLEVTGSITGGKVFAKMQTYDSFVPGCGCDPSPTADPTLACYGGYVTDLFVTSASGSGVLARDFYPQDFKPSPFGLHQTGPDFSQIINFSIVAQSDGAGPVSWDLWISRISIH